MMSGVMAYRSWRTGFGLSLILVLLTGCPSEVVPGEPTPEATESYVPMEPESALNRATMALAGLRPTPAELELVRNDPARVPEIVSDYVERPEFGETIKDMYAEILLMRSSRLALPSLGLLEDTTRSEIRDTLSEEPLNVIREVVMTNRPFTEVVTANWTVLDPMAAMMWAGHDYDTLQAGLQRVNFTDGRPAGGVMTTGPFLVRHESNGSNYHRGRASILSDVFLCEPFGGRDIPISGDVDLSDDESVANALNENPQCVACHQIVDPLAQHFWPFRNRLTAFQVLQGHNAAGCAGQFPCYPVPMYKPPGPQSGDKPTPWEARGLRAPNYWGANSDSLADVGQHMAQDPRFARCAVQQFAAYLTQTPRQALDPDFVGRHHLAFVASGYNAKELARSIVLDDWFLAQAKHTNALESTPEVPGLQVLRPEQLERFVESLTGFRLTYFLTQQNHGAIRTLRDDVLGFRAMAGGINGDTVTQPVHTATPVKLLVLAAHAEEAAGYVVKADFSDELPERRLLNLVEENDTDEVKVRDQLTQLHMQVYGRVVGSDAEAITDLYELWSAVASGSSPADGWKSVLTAMFQAPDVVFY